jgi:hypothetical protein
VLDHSNTLHCSRPIVTLSAKFDSAIVSPIRCRIRTGPITEFASEDAMIVEMSGVRPRSVRVARASIDQRERDLSHVEMNALQAIANYTGMTHELVCSMLDGSETYSTSNPALTVGALTARRGGKNKSIMRNFRKSLDGRWNRTQADEIDSGPSPVTVGDLDMRVTEKSGVGVVSIYFGKRSRGAKPDIRLELTGERLDTDKPHVRLRLL